MQRGQEQMSATYDYPDFSDVEPLSSVAAATGGAAEKAAVATQPPEGFERGGSSMSAVECAMQEEGWADSWADSWGDDDAWASSAKPARLGASS